MFIVWKYSENPKEKWNRIIYTTLFSNSLRLKETYERFSMHSVSIVSSSPRTHRNRKKTLGKKERNIANLKALIKQIRMSFEHDQFDRVNWTSETIFSKSSSTLEICCSFADLLDFYERHDTGRNKVKLNNQREKKGKTKRKLIQIECIRAICLLILTPLNQPKYFHISHNNNHLKPFQCRSHLNFDQFKLLCQLSNWIQQNV